MVYFHIELDVDGVCVCVCLMYTYIEGARLESTYVSVACMYTHTHTHTHTHHHHTLSSTAISAPTSIFSPGATSRICEKWQSPHLPLLVSNYINNKKEKKEKSHVRACER